MAKRIEDCDPANITSFTETDPRTLYTLHITQHLTFGIETIAPSSKARVLS